MENIKISIYNKQNSTKQNNRIETLEYDEFNHLVKEKYYLNDKLTTTIKYTYLNDNVLLEEYFNGDDNSENLQYYYRNSYENGHKILSGHYKPNDEPINIYKYTYENDKLVKYEVIGNKLNFVEKYEKIDESLTKKYRYKNDELIYTEELIYDDKGEIVDVKHYNNKNKCVIHCENKYDENNKKVLEKTIINDTFTISTYNYINDKLMLKIYSVNGFVKSITTFEYDDKDRLIRRNILLM